MTWQRQLTTEEASDQRLDKPGQLDPTAHYRSGHWLSWRTGRELIAGHLREQMDEFRLAVRIGFPKQGLKVNLRGISANAKFAT